VAASLGSEWTLVYGSAAHMASFCESLSAQGIGHQISKIPGGYGNLNDTEVDVFAKELRDIDWKAPALAFYDNGERPEGKVATASFWLEQLRGPALVDATLVCLRAEGYNLFLEVGAKPLLQQAGSTLLGEQAVWLTSLHAKRGDRQLARTLAGLYVAGVKLNMDVFYQGGYPVLSLPTYPFQRERFWVARGKATSEKAPSANPLVLSRPGSSRRQLLLPGKAGQMIPVTQLGSDPELARQVLHLCRTYGLAPGAVSQVTGRAQIFINRGAKAFFYCNQRDHLLVAQIYTGEEQYFDELVGDLAAHAQSLDLQLHLIVELETYRDRLEALGFSSTVMGVWQHIPDISSFSLKGNKMRHLRYAVNRYQELGDCKMVDYQPGSDASADARMLEIIDTWTSAKERGAGPLTAFLKDALQHGWDESEARYFIVYRNNIMEGFFIMVPLPLLGSQLMDVEFYGPEVPHGAMEFGIVKVIEQLAGEGVKHFSLGLTPFTHLQSHANEDPGVHAWFQDVHDQGLLNGDANFQFKNKFRTHNLPAWWCCQHGADLAFMDEVLLMMADPTNHRGAPKAQAVEEVGLVSGSRCHPLLGFALDLACDDLIYTQRIQRDEPAWLQDHCAGDVCLFPSTAYLEMARAAAEQQFGPCVLRDFEILAPLPLLPAQEPRLQTIWHREGDDRASFKVLAQLGNNPWVLHARGTCLKQETQQPQVETLTSLKSRFKHQQTGSDFYEKELAAAGYQYGPSFRGVTLLFRGEGEVLVHVTLPKGLDTKGYGFHPALLDACQQAFWDLLPPERKMVLPVGMAEFDSWQAAPTEVWAHLISKGQDGATFLGDCHLYGPDGSLLGRLGGCMFRQVSPEILARLSQTTIVAPRGQEAALTHQELMDAQASDRPELLGNYLCQRIGAVLATPVSQLARDKPIDSLGVDSLMVLEIRNHIRSDLSIDLPAVLFFDFPTLEELAKILVELAEKKQNDARNETSVPEETEFELPMDLDGLSDDEVDDMLAMLS